LAIGLNALDIKKAKMTERLKHDIYRQ